ncbi:MAG: NAD(P)/FAD-dependent oxidoreductase [Bacteroidota bacterium]
MVQLRNILSRLHGRANGDAHQEPSSADGAEHLVIIGNGIAGVTAARFVRKQSSTIRITVISGETDHFYSRTALMYIYMGHMRYQDTKPYEDFFWPKNRIDLVRDWVVRIDVEGKEVHLKDSAPIQYDKLLIATGSTPRWFGWPGAELNGVQGLYGMPDLEQMEAATQGITHAAVVGGGLIGVEMAEMLHSRGIHVTFLVREPTYMSKVLPAEESAMVNRVIREHGIDLRLGEELAEIRGDRDGTAEQIVTKSGEVLPAQFVGITIGVVPNLSALAGSAIETDRGVLVNAYLETNVPDVYAVGDCAQFREDGIGYKRIDQLWYTGRRQGKTVASSICGTRTRYTSSVFFNSAKFFNLEYQTYGTIAPNRPDGIESLYWEHPDQDQALRIDYEADSQAVVGFNMMGLRYRHDVCVTWIDQRAPLAHVVKHLAAANFDAEFSKRAELDALQA